MVLMYVIAVEGSGGLEEEVRRAAYDLEVQEESGGGNVMEYGL